LVKCLAEIQRLQLEVGATIESSDSLIPAACCIEGWTAILKDRLANDDGLWYDCNCN